MIPRRLAPRPHQVSGYEALRWSLAPVAKGGRGCKHPMLQAPVAAGKTVLAAMVIAAALEKGRRVAFVVDAISLIGQTVKAFHEEGILCVGVMQGEDRVTDEWGNTTRKWSEHDGVLVISAQTLERRAFPPVDLVIVDEAHCHRRVIEKWAEARPDLPIIGLSATPWTAGLGRFYDDLIVVATIRDLIEQGYLVPLRTFAPSDPDLTGVKIQNGDYATKPLSERMQEGALVADVVETWLRLGEQRPTFAFCVDRAHAATLQAQFQGAGVGAGYIDAYTEDDERRALFQRLRDGEIRVICSVGCLTKGVDEPHVSCVVFARPTRSRALFVQCIGRALRTIGGHIDASIAAGKADAILLDHSGTSLRLGLATSIHQEYLSKGRKGETAERQESQEPLPKKCGQCSFLKPPKMLKCPACGWEPRPQSKIECIDGELVELTPGAKPKRGKALLEDKVEWMAQLYGLARAMNRQPGWAKRVYRERWGVWPVGAPLYASPKQAGDEVYRYARSRDIAFRKEREKRREEERARIAVAVAAAAQARRPSEVRP